MTQTAKRKHPQPEAKWGTPVITNPQTLSHPNYTYIIAELSENLYKTMLDIANDMEDCNAWSHFMTIMMMEVRVMAPGKA